MWILSLKRAVQNPKAKHYNILKSVPDSSLYFETSAGLLPLIVGENQFVDISIFLLDLLGMSGQAHMYVFPGTNSSSPTFYSPTLGCATATCPLKMPLHARSGVGSLGQYVGWPQQP